MLTIGNLLGDKYIICNFLGSGASGRVYKVLDIKLNIHWAVKAIEVSPYTQKYERNIQLKTEMEVLKYLDHPGLPRIVDIIYSDTFVYIVMDFFEGETLKEIIQHEGIPCNIIIDWAAQLAEILHYLHSQTPPIIYRDLKPSNIIHNKNGNLKMIDFGASKIYSDSQIYEKGIGTEAFAAPEQYAGRSGYLNVSTDARTDIYCFGKTMLYIYDKNSKCDKTKNKSILIKQRKRKEELKFLRIIKKCTNSRPEDRYQNCMELLTELMKLKPLDNKKSMFLSLNYGKNKVIIPIIILFLLLCTFINIYQESKNAKQTQYLSCLAEAQVAAAKGDHQNALKFYRYSIEEIDKYRIEGYEGILNVYNALGKPLDGANLLRLYLESDKELYNKNSELIYLTAVTYFYEEDYNLSFQYFKEISSKKYPEVIFYLEIIKYHKEFDGDEEYFIQQLQKFEEHVDQLLYSNSNSNDTAKKIIGHYKVISRTYLQLSDIDQTMLVPSERTLNKAFEIYNKLKSRDHGDLWIETEIYIMLAAITGSIAKQMEKGEEAIEYMLKASDAGLQYLELTEKCLEECIVDKREKIYGETARYLFEAEEIERSFQILDDGIIWNPESIELHFIYLELAEKCVEKIIDLNFISKHKIQQIYNELFRLIGEEEDIRLDSIENWIDAYIDKKACR